MVLDFHYIILPMSLEFSRSLRSLRIDSFRLSRIGLVLAILILSALIAWFFLAKVTLFETSTSLTFSEEGRLMAVFPPESIKRIQPGQSAILRVSSGADQPTSNIPALVYGVDSEQKQIELLLMSSEIPEGFSNEKFSGQLEVEVEYITPAQLVLRSSGKVITRNGAPFNPQSFKETGTP